MEPHEHRLGHARRVVDARRAGGGAQDRLDAAPVLRVEAVARHEDEQRVEAAERIAPGEQAQALALAQVKDPHRRLEQLVVGDLEQLVARVGVEDLEQCLLVVAAGREGGLLEHLGHPPAQDRDLGRARAVRGVRVEAEEAVPVRRRRSRGRRARCTVERVLAFVSVMPPEPELRPSAGSSSCGSRRIPRPGSLGIAVAEEGEVVVGEPLEEGGRLGGLLAQLRGGLERLRPHRLPVLDRGAHLADHPHDLLLELAQAGRVGLPHDLGVDHRLADRALLERLGVRQDLEQAALGVAPHREDRVDDQVDPAAAPVQLHADRVDEERHVVGHDLDGGVRGLPAVLLEARVVRAHLRASRAPLAREVEVAERQAVEVERIALRHVLWRHPAVQLAREGLGEIGVVAVQLLAHAQADGIGQRLLGILHFHKASRKIVIGSVG